MSVFKLIGATLVAIVAWVALVGYGALNGWFATPLARPGDAQGFMDAAVGMINENLLGDASFVLIEDGKVFGTHHVGRSGYIDGDTLFPTASASKWITATAVMVLAEQGRIELDAPVERYLERWHLPTGSFDNQAVTVERLLSHTAGLTDGLGFGDYLPDEQVPTLVETLSDPRASSPEGARIELGYEPGTGWQYSGGGYLVLELLVEDVTGQPFGQYVKDTIFDPLGMVRSTYAWTGDLANAARSYDPAGNRAPLYRYASKGATAFATTANDMTRFVLAQLGVGPGPLSSDTIVQMRQPVGRMFGMAIWGTGTILYAPMPDGEYVFGHDGANEPAINASFRLNPKTRDAFIMLSTGGATLASTVGYQWAFWQTGVPDFLGLSAVLQGVAPLALAGVVVIVLLGLVAAVWLARRRKRLGSTKSTHGVGGT
jgi:CubicO group peptidase (beta-lactamase class C family)